jgi:hypothetical protein
MRRLAIIAFGAVLGLAAIESLSSYVFYRYYAKDHKAFRPTGSAAWTLSERLWDIVRGTPREVQMSIDHGPLFAASEVFGFTIKPGRYQVTEHFEGVTHRFDLHVTDAGRRASSYTPVQSSKRILVTGDSALFAWGLDDEESLPWLLQSRLPDHEVVNLTLTSYSTIQALLQLRDIVPAVGPNDIVVLVYHPVTKGFNVAEPIFLHTLKTGYELQLGDAGMRDMKVPFGEIDAQGNFAIRRIALHCADAVSSPDCHHPVLPLATVIQVTERAFDEVVALHAGHLVVAFVSGSDDDPVIAHLKSHGFTIADLRTVDGVPETSDLIPTDLHAGAFWTHQAYIRLLEALQRNRLVD